MRELNKLNQIILEKFASRQAYAVIKGHYIPIVMGNISDESVLDVEKRKYYIQSYEFTMLGFLIDEDEFEVSPAITRLLQVTEIELGTNRRGQINKKDNPGSQTQVLFVVGNDTLNQTYDYTVNITIGDIVNITSFDVYINNDYYGSNLSMIQINTGDILRFNINKDDSMLESTIQLINDII